MAEVLIVAPLVLDDVTTPAGAYRGELGGSATYAALAARHFAPTAIAAIVGDDFRADYMERLAGVDLSRVQRMPGSSFRWVAVHHVDGSTETRSNDPGATRALLPPLGDTRDSYVLLGAFEPALQERALGAQGPLPLGPAKFVAIDTMPCYIDEDAPRLRRAIAGSDLVFLTVEEAARLVRARDPESIRRALGTRILVLKDAARGAVICEEHVAFSVPAYRTTVVDATGAGDAFAGAFVATLAERDASDEHTLRLAGCRGAAAASIAIEDFGPRALERADRAEIERRSNTLLVAGALA